MRTKHTETKDTDTQDNQAAITEALRIIEAALPTFSARDLVESHEIVDLLLDTRRVLTAST